MNSAGPRFIANARMYSVSPEVAALWRQLLSAIIARAGVSAVVTRGRYL